MRVVLDTNTLVSAIGWEGPPARILRACRTGRMSLAVSPALLEELTRVLAYPKLKRVAGHSDLPEVLEWLYRPELLVVPVRAIAIIKGDPSDNRVLEAGVAARADAIVSGDEHLLNLREFEGIPIVTSGHFCRKWNL